MNDFNTQQLWVTMKSETDNTYYITSDVRIRDVYYLWKADKKGEPKLTKYKDSDPTNLYKYCKE